MEIYLSNKRIEKLVLLVKQENKLTQEIFLSLLTSIQ